MVKSASLLGSFKSFNEKLSDSFARKFPGLDKQIHLFSSMHYELSLLKGKKLCELGGIDRALFQKEDFAMYDGLDIDINDRVYEMYHNFFHESIENSSIENRGYDCVFSRFMVEHVEMKHNMFKNILGSLADGGFTMHYFPGGNHPVSLLNKLVGNKTQRKLIKFLFPNNKHEMGYPPHYNYCSYTKMKKVLFESGYSKVDIRYEFIGAQYFKFLFPFYLLVLLFNNTCSKLNLKNLASNYLITAYK